MRIRKHRKPINDGLFKEWTDERLAFVKVTRICLIATTHECKNEEDIGQTR